MTVVAVAPVYETAPVGGPAQGDYLNTVVAVDTALSARDLLGLAQRLEAAAQRVRTERWGPRTLDVDLLLIGDEEVARARPGGAAPQAPRTAFVLAPLGDLDPGRFPPPSSGWTGVGQIALQLSVPDHQ